MQPPGIKLLQSAALGSQRRRKGLRGGEVPHSSAPPSVEFRGWNTWLLSCLSGPTFRQSVSGCSGGSVASKELEPVLWASKEQRASGLHVKCQSKPKPRPPPPLQITCQGLSCKRSGPSIAKGRLGREAERGETSHPQVSTQLHCL